MSGLPVLYPLRSLDTATVRFTSAPHHRRRVTIDHRMLAGVTPEMLLDWFTHIGETMPYGGQIVPRYLAWHPIDHIHWDLASAAPGGGAGEGARFHIVEAFGARPEYKVDIVDRVEKLDETGIRLVERVAGVVVFQLEHTWSACSDGTHYVTVLDVGARTPLYAPVNRFACRRLPDDMLRAWVQHNIEEVGQLEYLLPQLKSGEQGTSATGAASPGIRSAR
ncbi:hypothetical protein BST27_22320 [Mycobacterium intermedium]|uniref:DAPG hydrolase PhiG domain-containing protein n=1 Tax=Mycobacterium intermedium TaxID=28445 RepID=A0A1E3SAA4_MYCIE|nr:hypothetical protein [Mycobacterium intermedium]MCV6967512.1 hypothetical protein [Mycobacterium intermedium]ODQ99105.1 hypothetical protein BHQ20_19160 [Mycobacterium intermedium]OPE49143.1 hypothetical protein BV508_15325 [Mycobacterium intermedium]ORA97522.1 hypothetical protein BST27_22320 [Mycobacterium intermedium]